MSHHLVKRFSSGERFIHWVHMISFITLALTGLGLYARSFFGLTGLFGGIDSSRVIHHYTGLVFAVTSLAVFFQWFKDFSAPGEDSLADVIKGYLDHSFHPQSGKINFGQKLLGWFSFLFGVGMIVTGLAMWFPFTLGRGLQQWMYFLHNFVFICFMLLMIVHVYLSTTGNPGTWRAMSRGTVTKGWAKKHHPKWDGEEA
ncbi:MAG: formate dehydrogenase subunit gamma [bacterium]|nr:formate dehydrogenase subunit gamma [bacterium]MDT8395180.1 formate dehydrogenase subunit gamma [bacterium]